MEKRTLTALAAAFALLILYPQVLHFFYPNYKLETPKSSAAAKPGAPAPTVADAGGIHSEKLEDNEDRVLNTGKLALTFNINGGGVRELSLPEFTNSETGKPIRLFSRTNLDHTALSVGTFEAGKLPDFSRQNTITIAPNGAGTSGAEDGIRVEKTLTLDGYSGRLRTVVRNESAAARTLRYQLIAGATFDARHGIDAQYHDANFYGTKNGKKELRHLKESGRGKSVPSEGFVDWVAVKDRHFSIIVKPDTEGRFTGLVEGLGEHQFRASLVSPEVTLPPGSAITDDFTVYMGPTELERLEPLGLGAIVNFGKMDSIGKVLVGALELIHKMVRNYGLAIIVLTALINLLLFPLTRQSFLSMKRMQTIQPHVKKLQEQHKNNPEKLNRETMELYKKHKVNPFGGCLPMLLQMPVFIALYVALSKSVILVNAPFMWIKDLSSPDRLPLGVTLPMVGDNIHVLPLLMSGAMFLQQKFSAMKMENQDPAIEAQQKMMAVMMPVLFGFIFYGMPSGLVLYWLTNTILMTAYQFSLKRANA